MEKDGVEIISLGKTTKYFDMKACKSIRDKSRTIDSSIDKKKYSSVEEEYSHHKRTSACNMNSKIDSALFNNG